MNPVNMDEHNILLVDDNPRNLAALARILTEHGYHVRTAINGQVALKSVQHMLADLILLDILMPEMDGYEVCQKLKANEATREIPVLFLSALEAPVDKVKAFEVGGVDYITKPFQADEVVARVETHIALRMMQKQLQIQNEELRSYRDHLEDLVTTRTTELTHTNEHLRKEIVERERITQSLQVSEQQYRLLAERVTDGILIIQDEQLVFVNAAFATIIASPTDRLLKLHPLTLFPDRVRKSIRDWLVLDAINPPELPWQAEIVTHNGETIWTELEQRTMVWDNHPALLLTIRNIHQQKLRELRLEQERTRLHQENLSFKSTLIERYRFGQLIGKSPPMQRVYELIVSAASSDANVLIVGESGTGKELIARTIYQVSTRKEQTFVAVNCASIPDTLFEREFFGHRKGTFTGADRDKPGFFDRAHRGVLFLDEVTELDPGTQAKLLRVLQDGEYLPLGSTHPKQADVLIIAATNQDPQRLIEGGKLREDFFYRIGVIEARVPPLRERKEDIPLLIEHILHQYHDTYKKRHGSIPYDFPTDLTELPGELIQALYSYHWRGNVRELQNVLHRYLATGHLEDVLSLLAVSLNSVAMPDRKIALSEMTITKAVNTFEKQLIADRLQQNHYRIGKTAESLGISRNTLHRKVKQYQLRESDSP